jgi:uncharacterized membrane protein (UPF0182 family)
MNAYTSTIALLVLLLIVLNGKAIYIYLEWLRFKIKTFFKQLENEHNHNPDN